MATIVAILVGLKALGVAFPNVVVLQSVNLSNDTVVYLLLIVSLVGSRREKESEYERESRQTLLIPYWSPKVSALCPLELNVLLFTSHIPTGRLMHW